jgi:hypothetical protein
LTTAPKVYDQLEELGPLRQPAPLTGQGEGRGEPLGDESDDLKVVLVEHIPIGLDIDDPEQLVAGDQRGADLAPKTAGCTDVVRIGVDIRDESRLTGADHPADHAIVPSNTGILTS